MDDNDIIRRILTFEGGFVNNPLDRGGATNMGITAAELGSWRGLGRDASVAEVQALTRDEAVRIYTKRYITDPKFNQITNANLRLIVVDSGVLHGVGRAARWLQQALGVTVDGALGQQTLAALNATGVDAEAVARKLLALRFKFIGQILTGHPKQVVFAGGWLNRVADLLEFA